MVVYSPGMFSPVNVMQFTIQHNTTTRRQHTAHSINMFRVYEATQYHAGPIVRATNDVPLGPQSSARASVHLPSWRLFVSQLHTRAFAIRCDDKWHMSYRLYALFVLLLLRCVGFTIHIAYVPASNITGVCCVCVNVPAGSVSMRSRRAYQWPHHRVDVRRSRRRRCRRMHLCDSHRTN